MYLSKLRKASLNTPVVQKFMFIHDTREEY